MGLSFSIAVVHTSLNTLLVRQVGIRNRNKKGIDPPLASTSVLLGEIFKLLAVTILLILGFGGNDAKKNDDNDKSNSNSNNNNLWYVRFKGICNDLFRKRGWKLRLMFAVPAILYAIQNQIVYLALRKIDAPCVQVLGQLRILFTAIFLVSIAKKKMSGIQWISLFLLLLGAVVVSLEQVGGTVASPPSSSSNNAQQQQQDSFPSSLLSKMDLRWVATRDITGIVFAITASALSSFSGVYCERVLKGTGMSFLHINLELSWISVVVTSLMVWIGDRDEIFNSVRQGNAWSGHDWVSILTAADCGLAGILISQLAFLTSSMEKVYAIVLSNIFTIVVTAIFNLSLPSAAFSLASAVILSSIVVYSKEEEKRKRD